MGIKHILAGGAILAGVFAYTTHQEAGRYDEMAKEFALSEAQTEVMRECRQSLSRHNRDFKDNIDQFRGCACVAKRLTDHVPTDQYSAASQMLDIIIERSTGAIKVGLAEQIRSDAMINALADVDKYRLVMNTTSAVGYCGRAKNHARQAVATVKLPKID